MGRSDRQLVVVESAQTREALRAALTGGPTFAPLSADATERERALTMLRPDDPVVEDDAAVVVSTSGSTGTPKGVVLTRRAIRAAVAATHARLGGAGSWVHSLPGHYVAGLMVLARAELAGTDVETVPGSLAGLPGAAARLTGRRYVSLVATQLRRALSDHELTEALAGFDAVLLGGAPAPPDLLTAAAARDIAVVTTYGMSETCGGCVYDGVPLDGTRVELTGDPERVVLTGPTVFAGYRLRPDLTAGVLAGDRFTTSDRGRLVDGRLQVLGRVDDVVMSGGLNVDLAAVEAAVADWPGRGVEIVVVGVPDPEWGTRVVAVGAGGTDDLGELRDWLSSRLPAYAAPRRLVVLAELPRTSGGKIDRRALVDRLVHPDDGGP